ncbi:MAG: hypothetical protein O7H39_20435 [Gammaproteobacteria bacterium]|nr:hypothetical protein [Gammaproteobacteria bacterium]
MPNATIEASAPGKLVLSGEYAVLAGAPAIVAAVDRRVVCRIAEASSGGWSFESSGFEGKSRHSLAALLAGEVQADDPGAIVAHALSYLARGGDFAGGTYFDRGTRFDRRALPEHLSVEIDSSQCFHEARKLGVGSSAGTVVAFCSALAAHTSQSVELPDLLRIHRASQGGSGSGLDVAAAFHGGVIRCQDGLAQPVTLPETLNYLFVYAGFSTATNEMLERFDAWRAGGNTGVLDKLVDAAWRTADACHADGNFLDALNDYITALVKLDDAAKIGILPAVQRSAQGIAEEVGVLYKPCGAGGGDTGVAVGRDPAKLREFGNRITTIGFTMLPLEIAKDGVKVSDR